MEKELQVYLKKLYISKRKFIFEIIVGYLILYAIIFLVSDSWRHKAELGAFSAVTILFMLALEYKRKKEASAQVLQMFEQLSQEEKNKLLEEFRTAAKEQWKAGFFVTPKIAIFTNGKGIQAICPTHVLWVYTYVYTYFPIFHAHTLYIYTTYDKKYTCDIGSSPIWSKRANDDAASYIIWKLCQYYPGIITGYDRKIHQLYSKDIGALRNVYRERQEKRN